MSPRYNVKAFCLSEPGLAQFPEGCIPFRGYIPPEVESDFDGKEGIAMTNRNVMKVLNKLRTSDLLVAKMASTKAAAFYRTIKLGLLGVLTVSCGQVVKGVYGIDANVGISELISAVLAVYAALGTIYADHLISGEEAKKELIRDLLAIRANNKSGKK